MSQVGCRLAVASMAKMSRPRTGSTREKKASRCGRGGTAGAIMIESPQQAGAARKPRTAPEVSSEKRCAGVVEDVTDADDFTERLAVAPIRLPVCLNKPRAPADTLSRLEKRNIAAQSALHEGGR